MKKYSKTIAAFVGAVGTWFGAAFLDGHISGAEWGLLFAALATVAGVYQVSNE